MRRVKYILADGVVTNSYPEAVASRQKYALILETIPADLPDNEPYKTIREKYRVVTPQRLKEYRKAVND